VAITMLTAITHVCMQIRHASVDRLLDRLTDLRFLSIDFLNTFLLTYRVFTTGRTVMEALRRVYHNPECGYVDSTSHLACRYPPVTLIASCIYKSIVTDDDANSLQRVVSIGLRNGAILGY